MKARRWERVGSLLGFLLLILSLLLSTLIDPVAGGSSSKQREQKKGGEQQKQPISLSSSSSHGQKNPSQNSTMRNTRQIPEIPALYSAPKPEIPALYSAPKINQKPGQDQNELDYDQMRATTEVTMIADDEEESPEENSSVDYQYGVPTEKYGVPSVEEGEVISDYPTDSPIPTSKSNESENDETDSYNQGYNNNREPSPQYGAPASPSQQQQPPAPPPPKNGRGRENSKRKMYSTPNRRPADQQQIENSLQPTTQMRPNQESGNGGAQEGYYLPPSKSEQKPRGDQRNEKNAYGADPNQYPQSKPTSYQAPQPQPQQTPKNGGYGRGEPQPTQQDRSSEGYPRSGPLPQEPSQQRSGIFPQQDSQSQNSQQGQQNPSQQGQYFGRDASSSQQQQPNTYYGAPGVNHFDSGSQDELEGLNEKIVDAELLQRVQQIIEDHERQQKVLLDNIQKDNEKAYLPPQPSSSSSSGYPTASGPSTFTGNELNGPNDFTAPAAGGGGYSPDFQSPNYNRYNSNGVASGGNNENGGAGAPDTARSPSYFNSINDVPSSNSGYPNNDYSNSNSYQSGGNSYNQNPNQSQQPKEGYPQSSSGRDNNGVGSGSPSSTYPGGYKNSQPENRQGKDEPRKLSGDVEYQKAVLSTHFTETQPDPQYSKSTGSSGGYQQRQGDEQQKLNSVAGPGEEYLPPVPQNRQLEQQQQYELPRNVQNVEYSNSFPADSQVQASNGRSNGEEQGYSVKVGTGILVSDGGQPIPSYNYGSLPPQPSSFSSSQRNFQDGSSAPGVFGNGERFPQPVQSLFPSQQQPPSPNPSFWSRGNLSPQPQANYGAPLNQEVDNGSQQQASSSRGVGEQGSVQIKYSNPGLSGVGGALGDQGSAFVQPQYGPPTTPFNNNNPAQQPYNGVVDNPNGNTVMIAIPRPVYGVPLAPVITLDSDNNLPSFNGSPAGGELSYSPDAIKTSTSTQTGNEYALDQGLLGQGRFDQAAPGANYLPPSQYNGSPSPIGNEDLSNSLHLQSSPPSSNDVGPSASYGIRDNNPSSSSSAYLSIQGHGGNSNNHIYNINHNGYGSSSSSSFGIGTSLADPSSIIIPGISNTFTLPVYDYSPTSPHHQNGDDELSAAASSSALSTSPVVVPLEHLLEQLQAASHSNSPTIFYGSSAGQDNVRVLRRALSKTGNVSAATPNPNREQLGTSRRSSSNNNDSKSSHPPSSSTSSSSQPKTNSHLPRRRT